MLEIFGVASIIGAFIWALGAKRWADQGNYTWVIISIIACIIWMIIGATILLSVG